MKERFKEKKERFYEKYRQSNWNAHCNQYIYVDKETGVNYLFMDYSDAGGLTPLLDREGKPIITKEDIE